MNNIFDLIPEKVESEIFENLVQSDKIRIERIISRGHVSPSTGWYVQEENEWVMVLRGKAILEFEDSNRITLSEGDYLNISSQKKHKVSWTDPDIETIWLAVHY